MSVFTCISAFCNAGFDLMGMFSVSSSLTTVNDDPLILITTMLLIVFGGLGFFVWEDMRENRFRLKRLSLHSKLVLATTTVLIFGGAALMLLFENDRSLEGMNLFEKLLNAMFCSITPRTAGFNSVDIPSMSNTGKLLTILLMFIGGSPVGTAGGIKTVTFAVIIVSAIASIRNKEDTEVFGRRLTKQAVSKAVAVTCMSFIIMFASTVLLSVVTDANALDIIYETVSATATVGLTRNLTASLGSIGKVIIIITMYLGRVGPISLAVAFMRNKDNQNIVRNPIEEISVG